MSIKKQSVSLDAKFKFPRDITSCFSGEDVVVVSPNDGNWLVVSKPQFEIFNQLRSGKTVGDVIVKASDANECISLLKQICARRFVEKNISLSNRNSKVLFYLTYDCNLKCKHCYMHAQKSKGDCLTILEYETIFKQLKENGVVEITLTGGEPLMHHGFWEIVKCANRIGLITKVFSNGILWTENDIRLAKELGIKVQISIDGVDEISCSAVRGANVFAKAKNLVIQLAILGVDVEIATTPIWENIKYIERGYADFVKEIRERTGNKIKFRVSLNLLPGRETTRLSGVEKKEYERIGIKLYSIANPSGSEIPFFDDYKMGRGRIACGIGRLVFTPDGFAHVCSRIDRFKPIGNVKETNIPILIEKAISRLAAASVDNTIPCKECFLRHICGGGCRADRYTRVSNSLKNFSIHKPCTKEYKMTIIGMMKQATKECYTWDGTSFDRI